MTEHRSVSQVKEYAECPHRWYLHRVKREWERPAAWLPQGLAVHEAAEAWELSGRTMTVIAAQDVFRESYAKHTNRLCEQTPRFDFWFRSGPYGGEKDVERRFSIGLEQTEKYITYYTEKAPDEVVWIAPDGTPGVELAFDIELDGVKVVGFIDNITVHPTRGIGPRDNKTGNAPGDEFQLATYKVALELMYGLNIEWGDYWMGRTGKPTVPYDLTDWTVERVAEIFKETDELIRAERFDPDPEQKKCMFCPVSASCTFAR